MAREILVEIYKKLGAHKAKKGKTEGVYFAVWAPHAESVSVVEEFNDWDKEIIDGENRAFGNLYMFCSQSKGRHAVIIVSKRTLGNSFIIDIDLVRQCSR